MGANAQTKVPTFAAAEVLTAANTNLLSNGIPVFSGTATRNDAFGGSGEKTLAEGQFAYLEDSNSTQFYDGAAWQSVSGGGLVVVQPETALSAAATLTLDGCFTSSYTNYRLHINGTGAATSPCLLQLRVGGVAAATNYNRQVMEALGLTANGSQSTNQTSYTIGFIETDFRNSIIVDIFQPAQAQFTNFYGQNVLTSGASTTNVAINVLFGIHSAATAYDGFILTFGTDVTGSYTLYGYGK
jgi:hypothetical protein